MSPATYSPTKVSTYSRQKQLSDNVHWKISKESKKKEHKLMNHLSISQRKKFYDYILHIAYLMNFPSSSYKLEHE